MSLIDAKAIVVKGVPFAVKIVPDDRSRLDDYECYSDVNRRHHERDEWQFVGVIVVNERTGQSDSVWGNELGTLAPDMSVSVTDIAEREDIVGMAEGLL